MLADAKAVTGNSTTKLTVLALEQLPDLLAKWQRDQAAGIAQFLKQHAGAQMPEAQPEHEEAWKGNQVVSNADAYPKKPVVKNQTPIWPG